MTNASRTLLASLRTLDWDDELLALFGVDRGLLPRIIGSAEPAGEGELLGTRAQIRGIAGDQQAALYGQGCHAAGEGKATYGTGTFVLVHTGDDASAPPPGLLKTAAADGYAHEGAVLVGGAALQWLRDGLGLLSGAAESEALAESVDSTGGVVFVPALTGLGSPWWDADARGLIAGLTRGTTTAHLVRAALEAIAHQVADVVEALPEQPVGPACRRRRDRECLPDAVPGGSARDPGRGGGRARDDRARGRRARRRPRGEGRRRGGLRAEALARGRGSTSPSVDDGFEPISNLTRSS